MISKFVTASIASLALLSAVDAQQVPQSGLEYFVSPFPQPIPPLISNEFSANFMLQINNNVTSVIESGYLYVSNSQRKIRVDAGSKGIFQARIFDFTNITNDDNIPGTLLTYYDNLLSPVCSNSSGTPFILLYPTDFLSEFNATYIGQRHVSLYGFVNAWQLLIGKAIPLTLYLGTNDTFVGYDFAIPQQPRSFGTMRFFNIQEGSINATTFETVCA